MRKLRHMRSDVMTDWQPIETAPKDGTRVLTAKVGGPVGMSFWLTSSEKWWDGLSGHSRNSPPTHWMPLPHPPAH